MVVRAWDHLALAGGDVRGDGNVVHLDCGRGDMSAYCWQNSLTCTLKVARLDVNYKSTKLVNQKRKET